MRLVMVTYLPLLIYCCARRQRTLSHCARRQRTLAHCARCFTCFTEHLTRLPLLVVPRLSWGISGSGPVCFFCGATQNYALCPRRMARRGGPHAWTSLARREAPLPLICYHQVCVLFHLVWAEKISGPHGGGKGIFWWQVRPQCLVRTRLCTQLSFVAPFPFLSPARLASPSLPSAHLPCRIPRTVWHRWSWLLLLRMVEVGSSSVVLLVDVLPIYSDLLPLCCF
jgi:hypothetical protein